MLRYKLIVNELRRRRDLLDEVIASLESIRRRGPGRPPGKRRRPAKRPRPAVRRRTVSAATRAKMAAAARARWRRSKAGKSGPGR